MDYYKSTTGVECIDAIKAATEHLIGEEAFMTGAVMKYMWRWKKKGGKKDLEKARAFIDMLIARTHA